MIDSADDKRLEETAFELNQLLDEDRLSRVPVLIMANKQDLLNAQTAEEITLALSLNVSRTRTWQILPCSAKTGEGLQDAMEWIVEQINTSGGKVDTVDGAFPEGAVASAPTTTATTAEESKA